jgi:putative IMPACT (imprinted ancient) family translation regulator
MRAYGQTAQTLLRSSEPARKFDSETVKFTVDFDFVSVAHYIISNFSAELEDSHYGEKVTHQVRIRASRLSLFKSKLIEATNGQIEFK